MKGIILTLILLATVAKAAVFTDGAGFFPVMVQVVEADSGTPLKGVTVRLEDTGSYKEAVPDPKRRTKIIPESLGKSVATNAEGVAVVFYYAGWSSTKAGAKTTYERPLIGTVVVEWEGRVIYRETLKAWAAKNDFKAEAHSVPWIVVSPPARK